jgi:flagellar basal-body rod protein FlgF
MPAMRPKVLKTRSTGDASNRIGPPMENTLMIALSHQAALRRRMDIVANNIANMNTTGFKAEQPLFAEHLVRNRGGDTILGDTLSFVLDQSTLRDTSAGGLEATGSALDVAIRGEGFFAVETPAGEQYTRNGRFRLSPERQLITEHGHAVLGEDGGPLVFGPADTEITISQNAMISSKNGEIGRLRIVRFDDQQRLQMVAGGLMTADTPAIQMAFPEVEQGMIENSNVEAIREMTRMIEVHRSYDRTKQLIDREDERIRNMMETYAR